MKLPPIETGHSTVKLQCVMRLPFPPSVNSYWRHIVRGHRQHTLLSAEARQYKKDVADHLLEYGIKTVLRGDLMCTVDLYPPDNRVRDVDNYCKGLLDALCAAGLYHDDNQIKDLHVRMFPKTPPGSVHVTISEMPEQVDASHKKT